MKNFLINLILVIVCFLLQTTVLKSVALAGVTPNLLLIFTVSLAFIKGKKYGMYAGLFCGLLFDTMYGSVIGGYGLIYMYIGYITGFANKLFYIEELVLPLSLITVSDLVYNFVVYMFTYLLHNKLDVAYYFRRIMIPEMIYTLLVSVFMYKIIYALNIKLDKTNDEEVGKLV